MDQDQFQLGRTKIFIKAPESVRLMSHCNILLFCLVFALYDTTENLLKSKNLQRNFFTCNRCTDVELRSHVRVSAGRQKALFVSKETTELTFYTKHHKRALVSRCSNPWCRRRLNPTLAPRQHWVNTALELKHKHRLWLQSLGGHRKGLSFSTISTFFMIPMKATFVQSPCSHLLTFVHAVHERACTCTHTQMKLIHRHLSFNSGRTADPECLYLFIAAMHARRPPSPTQPDWESLRCACETQISHRADRWNELPGFSKQASVSDKTLTPAN